MGQGTQLRQLWPTMNLERQAAIMAAVLDYATINPAITKGGQFSPTRISPVWNL